MNQERTHGQHAAASNKTLPRCSSSRSALHLIVAEYAGPVCAGQNLQGPVFLRGIVQMEAQGQDLFKRTGRGVSINDALFYGPWSPAGRFALFYQWKGRVLMPGDEPIRVRRLVEKGGAEGKRYCSNDVARGSQETRVMSDCIYCGMAEDVTYPGATGAIFEISKIAQKRRNL